MRRMWVLTVFPTAEIGQQFPCPGGRDRQDQPVRLRHLPDRQKTGDGQPLGGATEVEFFGDGDGDG